MSYLIFTKKIRKKKYIKKFYLKKTNVTIHILVTLHNTFFLLKMNKNQNILLQCSAGTEGFTKVKKKYDTTSYSITHNVIKTLISKYKIQNININFFGIKNRFKTILKAFENYNINIVKLKYKKIMPYNGTKLKKRKRR